jgi:hypothetical protein
MAAGVVSFIAHSLTLYACSSSIRTHLARIFCLSPDKYLLPLFKPCNFKPSPEHFLPTNPLAEKPKSPPKPQTPKH